MEDTTELFGIEKVHVLYIDCDVLSQDEDVWEVSNDIPDALAENDQMDDIAEYITEEECQFEDDVDLEEETEEEETEEEEDEEEITKPYVVCSPV